MDPPRFLHQQHHRRYVPPPPLQHRHPPPLHENRHFFEPHHNNHHHHFTPPLPAPPQPPAPPSYRPLPAPPPPPPYNPHQSQFTFRNPSPNPAIDENHHHHLDFNSLPSRTLDEDHLVPHRMPPKFDHFSDTRRRDVWDSPPRGLPENSRSIRAYPAVDLGHESRHHVFDRKPVSPYPVLDEFKHDSEGSSRFRDGYFPKHKDEFAWDGIEDCGDDDYRRDSHFVLNQDKSYKISGFGKSQVSDLNLSSRELAANLGNFESRYGSEFDGELFRYDREDGVSENQRWGCSRQPLRNLPDSSYMGNDGFRDGDDVRVFSGKNASGASEYGNFDRKGSRESTQEYDRTPRKQIQKKSAFLRIQMGKPSLRNRDGAQLQSLGYYVDSNSSPFRGKDTPVYSNRRNKEDEREREGSPVELDVSFKSNLLVAKPVVTPSGPAVSSGRNLTPNSNRKIRKLTYSDTDNSSSPEVKVSEGRLKSEISMHVNSPSNSVTDVKQSETKCTVSSGGSSSYICSKPLANGTNVSLGKRTVERSPKAIVSAKDGNNVGSGGKYLPKVTKKKVVKKVMIRRSSSSNAQPLNKLNEPGKAGSSTHGPSAASRPDKGLTQLIENTTSAGPVSGCSVDLLPSPNEVTMLPVNNKFDGSPQVLVSDEGGTKIEIGKEHLPDSDAVKKRISSKEEYHGLEGTTDRPVHLHAMSNPDSGLIEFQDNITFPEIDHVEDVCKQSVNNGINVELENDVIRVYPQATSTGYNLNIGLSGSEESKIYEVPVNSHSSSPVAKNELSTDNPLINYHENVTVSDVDTVDDGSKLPFANQVTESHEHGLIPGFLKDASLIDLSSSEENINLEGPLDLYRSNHGAVTELNSDYDLFNLQEKITVPNIGCQDHFWKQPCPDEVTISLENGLTEGSPTAMVSAGGNINVASGKECSPNKIRNRELRSPRWNSLSPSTSNLCVGPLIRVGSGDGLDISTSTINNSRPANKEIAVYGVGDLDVVLELCTDGFHDLQRNVSLEGFSEEKILVGDGINGSPNRISHECKKKRKLFNSPTRLSGSTVSEINELPATADSYTSGAEVLLNSNNGLAQTGEIALSGTATVCTAGLASCLNGKAVLHENTVAGASFETLSLVKDGFRDDVLNLEQQSIDSGSIIKETAIPNMLFRCPLGIGNERTENATSFMVTTDQQYVNMVMESIREEETDVHYTGEQVMINGKTTHCQIPLELQTPDSNQTFCSSDMECDSSLVVNDDFPSMSNFMSSSAYGDGVSITDFTDEGMHSLPDIPSNMGSPEYSATASGVHLLSPELSIGQTSHEMVSGDDEKLKGKCVVTAGSDLLSFGRTSSEMVFGVDEKVEKKSLVGASTDHVTGIDHLFTKKAVPLPSQDFKTTTNCQSPPNVEANRRKNQAVPRMLPGRASIYFTNSGKTASSTQITKPRTWRRTGNPAASPLPGKKLLSTVPPLNQSSKKIGKVQTTSYIRKGNSLVRKPPLATALPQGSHGLITSVYRLSPSDIGELKKSTRSDGRVHLPDPSNFSGAGGMNAASQNPGPVTLPHSPGYCTSSPLTEPVISDCSETTSEPKLIEDTRSSEDAPKFLEISENQCVPVKSLDSQGEDCDNLVSLNMSKIIYVKRKSNQLVAATSPCNPSVKDADKTHASFSDGFYKRKRNQLIRTALESPFNQQVAVLDDSSNSKGQMAHRATSSRSFSKRWSDKVVGTSKLSKSSLVWTLRGAQSSKEIDNSMQHQKVLPHLFPWKRGTYWKKFRHNSATISSNSTSSMISKKLSLFRNRGAVYTRSTHGFSLRKSKVLSVGGRSLKWSISIEKRSKKANEEATLAVAAAERKKIEENGAASVMYGVKTRNHSSRERIYRIGSVRYKMDASKRTLQRISADDDTSFSAALQEKDVKKSYVPRRLVIGNDEYVRIGNGNQLIRDPKKRTRTLANEKVRWSLHTARLRLAKKRKYCQFFTRFGKCNKDNGKCPYIHDPSKIAVCTKFLKGLCSNPNCKLTHKVIPERMQDCSYFLQGLCSNENCPYRHVNVNPNSSTCEGFLRGYCADGNECRKKHSYVCPVFEASGLCPEGSKCKLHHPKRKSEGKKKKRLREQNAQGRYFGSPQIDVVEREGVAPEKHSTMNNDDLILADYISLDDSDEETGETMDLSRSFDDSDSLDGQVDNLDELVKPVRLMNNNLTT